jgi:hypothetical protein
VGLAVVKLALVLCAGCSLYGSSAPPDASPPDAPHTAITFTGTIYRVTDVGSEFTEGATVELLALHGAARLGGAVSQPTGSYSFTVDHGGAPLDAYLHVSKPGLADTSIFPASPYTTGEYRDAYLVDTIASADQDPWLAHFDVFTFDHDGNALLGADVTITPRGSATMEPPNPDYGLAIFDDVPLGAIYVSGAPALRGHWVDARANTFTLVMLSQ